MEFTAELRQNKRGDKTTITLIDGEGKQLMKVDCSSVSFYHGDALEPVPCEPTALMKAIKAIDHIGRSISMLADFENFIAGSRIVR